MTSNQINNRRNIEQARANRAQERETARSNKAREKETVRANKAKEGLTSEQIEATKRGQNLGFTGDVLGSLLSGAGRVGSAIIGAANDPSWYNKDPQLVKDVAQISFNTPITTQAISVKYATSLVETTVTTKLQPQPGVMALCYVPTLGQADGTPSDAVNIAARNIYSYVRYANSGASNYEPQDLMIYLLAMDSLYTLFAWGVRAYSALNSADRFSGFFPTTMCHAMGMKVGGTSDDWTSNISNFRAYLNRFGVKISAFNVPSNFPYFNRHMWLNSNVFSDMNIRRSSYYVFRPSYLYQYDSLGGGLMSFEFALDKGGTDRGLTFEQYVKYCESALSFLNGDEDIGIISGDILKAYGIDQMFKIGSVPETMPLAIVYSEEVLSQISGATVCDVDDSWLNILQNDKGIIAMGQRNTSTGLLQTAGLRTKTGSTAANLENYYVNMIKDDPTPDDVMVATRLTALGDFVEESATTKYTNLTCIGTEVVNQVDVLYMDVGLDVTFQESLYPITDLDNTAKEAMLRRATAVSKFDWSPMFFWVMFSATNAVYLAGGSVTDLGNTAIISKDNLTNMHYVATLSEYAVPDIGNKARSR